MTGTDIRTQLVPDRRVEVNTASGWLPGVITQVTPARKRGGWPLILVRYDYDGNEWWTGDQSIRLEAAVG
jgi:hypothetical protein